MIDALIGAAMAAELTQAEVELNKTADIHFAQIEENEVKYTVTYDVSSRGTVHGDMDEFRATVKRVLTDSRGWRRAGVKFVEVESGGQLHMILAEPHEVWAAAPGGCSDKLSCTVKPLVLINDDRWMYATDSYNSIGVDIEQYREMVINHEVGHFLGHGHITQCETESGKAPIMLQQSTGLRGCAPSYWPLSSELWVRGL